MDHWNDRDGEEAAGGCPPFRLVEQRKEYDIRWYPSYKWVSTIIVSEERLLAQWEALSRLDGFFAGYNDQGLSMNATLPLLTQIKYSRHPGVLKEIRDVTVSLPLPRAQQNNPTLPVSDRVSPTLPIASFIIVYNH